MLSLGSMETDHLKSEIICNRHKQNNQNLEAMTWPCYIENRTIVKCVIMRLNCIKWDCII